MGASWRRLVAVGCLAVWAGGCAEEHAQHALRPAGEAATHIAALWWVLFAVCAVVFLVTMALLFMAVMSREGRGLGTRFVVTAGVGMPAVVLIALLVVSLNTSMKLRMPEAELTIRVVGHSWWWEVTYPQHGIVTANELHIPAGRPVKLELTSADVIHSFWVPNLHGKMDLIPDHTNAFWISADEPGEYRGQCAEFCGAQHARMALVVVAMEAAAFDRWIEERRHVQTVPENPVHARGREVFFEAACHNCHTIAGTRARGTVGPDLTLLATRRSIAAGQLANTYGNLAGWVSNPQAIKPGNRMPRSYLEPDDLHALVEYLRTLQ